MSNSTQLSCKDAEAAHTQSSAALFWSSVIQDGQEDTCVNIFDPTVTSHHTLYFDVIKAFTSKIMVHVVGQAFSCEEPGLLVYANNNVTQGYDSGQINCSQYLQCKLYKVIKGIESINRQCDFVCTCVRSCAHFVMVFSQFNWLQPLSAQRLICEIGIGD